MVILDEIDRVSRRTSTVGNPSAALLELLDPAQNTAFVDRYAGVPVDLSEVMWIGTANDLEAMPAPLRDRMDVIEVPGYTDEEKLAIVRRHLDRIIEDSGLAVERLWTGGSGVTPRERRDAGHDGATARPTLLVKATDSVAPAPSLPVEITDAAIRAVIRGYTCESGVRQLLRLVGAVCEEVACRRVTTGDASPVLIVAHDGERPDAPASSRLRVDEVLGPARHETVPDAVRDVVAREQERVMALPRADPEAARAFDWIEVATDLPWNRRAARVDAPAVKPALDRAHVGCEQQKQRLLDHLAAADADTGKTALARSLAAALGRGFVEVSLAGVHDAAAIRGIARPRPDAAPGCLVTGLRQLGVPTERKAADPVVVLDQLDQLAEGPAADALLDALDPDRNHVFRDHYVGLPIDLSAVTWLATAADPERVPGTLLLRDRETADRGRARHPAPVGAARVDARAVVVLRGGHPAPDPRVHPRGGGEAPRPAGRRLRPAHRAPGPRGRPLAGRGRTRGAGRGHCRAAVPRGSIQASVYRSLRAVVGSIRALVEFPRTVHHWCTVFA